MFPVLRRYRGRLLLLLSLLGGAALAGYMHWDERGLFWLQQQRSTPAERAAAIWLPDYHAVIDGKPLQGLEEDETSGLTYHPATGTLFTVTGRNPLLVELSRQGDVLRRIRLRGFADPEAVEVLGANRLGIVDERRRQLVVFELSAATREIDAADWPGYDLGFASAGNKGFEGMAWNPRTQSLLLAKEREPLGLFSLPFPGEDGAPGALQPLHAGHLFVRDLSSLTYDLRTGHTLVLSDESRLLLELDAAGQPVSFISLLGGQRGLKFSIGQAEGVAMDEDGTIYLVSEPNLFYVLRKR